MRPASRLLEMDAVPDNEAANEGSSDENYHVSPVVQKVKKVAPWLGLVAVVGVVCTFAMGGQVQMHTSSHGIFDAPQFKVLLSDQVRPYAGQATEDDVKKSVDVAVHELHNFAKKHVPEDQAAALGNLRLNDEDWTDLQSITAAMSDDRVKAMGRIMLDVIGENLFSSKDVIGQKVMERMQPRGSEIMDLRAELFTPRVNHRSLEKINNGQGGVIWEKMLGEKALASMRSQASAGQQGRELAPSLPWVPLSVTQNTNNLVLGILSTVFITAGEVMLHVELWWPKIQLPAWAWDMMFEVGAIGGVASCKIGMSFWCDYALGALGLNLIDALFVLICGEAAKAGSWLQKKCAADFYVLTKMKKLSKSLPGVNPSDD